jgi:hypothetical protein
MEAISRTIQVDGADIYVAERGTGEPLLLLHGSHRPTQGESEAFMQDLTVAATLAIRDLAHRYGVSEDAVRTLLFAVSAGGGTMAQFYHAELGGNGQWMRGGMTMVGDMFNAGLQSRVSGLCSDLSSLLASQTVFAPAERSQWGSNAPNAGASRLGAWWPGELGSPSSSGGQNDSQYAYFPAAHRLAIRDNGRIAVYDTLDHRIGGVQQQQGGASGSLSFSSQYGTFDVSSLPKAAESPGLADVGGPAPASVQQPAESWVSTPPTASAGGRRSSEEILAAVERLGDLHRKGVLTDGEFQAKKVELLAQL